MGRGEACGEGLVTRYSDGGVSEVRSHRSCFGADMTITIARGNVTLR